MENSFSVKYKDEDITVQQLPGDQHGNLYYVVHLQAEDLRLEYTEDDEGAWHWIDEKANHETEVSTEIGRLIELYMVQHKTNT